MTFHSLIRSGLNYKEYRFGRARQLYRGPRPDLSGSYVACIGGSETFGRFAASPWPEQLERILGYPVANFGQPGAGAHFFNKDPALMEALSNARACVVSATGAHLITNRLYSVYPRRNQRLKGVSEMMEALYPEVDFGVYRYTMNMLVALHRISEERFRVVEVELRNAWIARMRELLADIDTPKVLLWLSTDGPGESGRMHPMRARDTPPGFINRHMIEAVKSDVSFYVEYIAGKAAQAEPRISDADNATIAMRYPSDQMHLEAAKLLVEPVGQLCNL